MNSQRWSRVRPLLEEALEKSPAERRAFLDQECDDDSALREEVDGLLDLDESAGDILDQPELLARPAKRALGPYRLLTKIGEGGMSSVHLAVRADDEYRKLVAIKLIRGDLETGDLIQRFLIERQILACLDHPNIAKLLDGGRTGEGSPYFVMEYIDGIPIDSYCDEQRLSISERLALFRTVCSAVEYAHRNLVVHRDIKPSNILVQANGVPKLLDFGLAKVLESGPSPSRLETTAAWIRLMTPSYASPEQVQGGRVSTACDVYSLGVLLYKLLSGRLPYRFPSGGLAEVERVLREGEPPKPSLAVAGAAPVSNPENDRLPTPEVISQARRLQPDQLKRRLAGDLDSIVLMALRKEPERRYPSVDQLSEDVRRHLEGLPVRVRPPTLTYRAGKFVRRHALRVAVAAVFVMLLLGFGVVMRLQSVRAARERDQARQVAAFLKGIFELSDPEETGGEAVTARLLLDRGAERVTRELPGQPALSAALMTTLGRAYSNLGLYEQAQPLLEKSLEMQERAHGADRPDYAETLVHLAWVLRRKGDFGAAEGRYRRALAITEKHFGDAHPERVKVLLHLSLVLFQKGDKPAAQRLADEALALHQRGIDVQGADRGEYLNSLALVLYSKSDLGTAETVLRESVAVYRQLGDGRPQLASTLSNLGSLVHRAELRKGTQADYTEAASLQREALQIWRRSLGDRSPMVAYGLSMLGEALHAKGEHAEAEAAYREALSIQRETLGDEHLKVADTLYRLGGLLAAKGDHEGAEQSLRDALRIWRKTIGEKPWQVNHGLQQLGRILIARGDARSAERVLREGLALRRQAHAEGHWKIAQTEAELGAALSQQKRYGEAEPLLANAYQVMRQKLGERHEETILTLNRLIRLYTVSGRPEKASQYRALLAEVRPIPVAKKPLPGRAAASGSRGRPTERTPGPGGPPGPPITR